MSEPVRLVPCFLSEARAFVDEHHRHHPAPVGGLFAVAVARAEDVVGVAIVGRPVARKLDGGFTAEVTRLCVLDGNPNACSMLYGACWRAARAIGYRKLITYTLKSESGASLRASGWRVVGEVRGRSWDTPSRPRVDKHPTQDKIKWEAPNAVAALQEARDE